MNYIKEINAFMDWLETNPLDAISQALWFHIMGIANKSGWLEWFTIANLTLMARVNISENTLIKHRNFLIQRGRIEYKNQGKHKAGKYRLIPFTSNTEVKPEVNNELTSNNEVNLAVNREVKCAVNREVNPSALYKLNETKLKNNDDDNPFKFYSKNIAPLVPMISELITQYQNDLPADLLIEGMKIAVKQNARNPRY